MKTRYIISIITLLLLIAGFVYVAIYKPFGEKSPFEVIIQGLGVFVAVGLGIIALHSSDLPSKSVSANISYSLGEFIEKTEANLPKDAVTRFKKKEINFPYSECKLILNIKNISGFTLKNPTVTFCLPIDKRHPADFGNGIWELSFNSNLRNTIVYSAEKMKEFESGNYMYISNTILNYLQDDASIQIWVRLIPGDKPFNVLVSLDCDNSEGFSQKIKVIPERKS